MVEALHRRALPDEVHEVLALLQLFLRHASLNLGGLDKVFEFRPTGKAVLPGDHQLGITQGQSGGTNVGIGRMGEAGVKFPDTGVSPWIASVMGHEEILGLLLEMIEMRRRGEQLGGHDKLLSSIRLVSA
ncbi:MAG: hypothetical protein HY709_06165 [Candidatus Latescibacteria bacterium]|nr:hypothetical protein [Candidatus Latescibacterota bacterium]